MAESEFPNMQQISVQLEALLAQRTLKPGLQETGERLLARLTSDIEVVLAGPMGEPKAQLCEVLQRRNLPRTKIRLAQTDVVNDGRVDVCIWCTEVFGPHEAASWHGAPDRLKDHSFLVPVLRQQGDPVDLDRLAEVAANDFFVLFPINSATLQRGQPKDEVEELTNEIEHMVRRGLAADADNAELFLSLHGESASLNRPRAVRRSVPLLPRSTARAVSRPHLSVFDKALETLEAELAPLSPFLEQFDEADCDQIFSVCGDATEAVADRLADAAPSDERAQTLSQEVQSATDRILLLSLEGGLSPAAMAVTTVLQVKRDIEVGCAR
ncbi:MAG: hypothetical protein AAF943_03490 [Pseudomonadota bacterium]